MGQSDHIQLLLDLLAPCSHKSTFLSMAYVPAGDVCCDCGLLVWQMIPTHPAVLGYKSADWAWHYDDGRPWTTQNPSEFRRKGT